MMGNDSIAGPIFIEACITQSALILFFAFTIYRSYKRARLDFVVSISALLMVSALSWILECRTNVKFYETDWQANTSCHEQKSADTRHLCRVYLWWEAVNTCSFNNAIWLFAIRYWLLAKRIEEGTISKY